MRRHASSPGRAGVAGADALKKTFINKSGAPPPSLCEEPLSDGSGILLPRCLPFAEGDGCKRSSNERVLGLETFTRLSISTHLPAVSPAHLGNILINSEAWGWRGRQMQPNREEGPGPAGDGQGGIWASVYQGGQRTS